MTEALLLLAAALLVIACGVFVAAEFSLVTVDRSAVDAATRDGDRRAAGVQRALQALSTQLSGAQVGITLTNLAIGFLAEPAVAALLESPLRSAGLPASAVTGTAVGLGMAIATLVTMVFGELVPKNIAIARPLRTARATTPYQRAFTAAMRFPIRVLNGSANAVVLRLGVEPQEELRSARSADELSSLVRRSAVEGTLDPNTAHLLARSVAYGDRSAADVMTPRVQMTSIDATASVTDLITLARSSAHSRFPVLGTGVEDVVGAVHVKHAATVPAAERATTPVTAIMRKVTEVPTTVRLDPLSDTLRGEGFQLAVVVDEYGGTAGLVTLEDVVEEIVGDIADEHDRLHDDVHHQVRHRPDGSWSVSGLLRPDEVAEVTGIVLPDHEDYDTVAGLLLRHLGRMPAPGDTVVLALPPSLPDSHTSGPPVEQEAVLTVAHLDGLRIDRIDLSARESTPADEDPA